MEKKGISRKKGTKIRKGKKVLSWIYFDHQGKAITENLVIDRCNKLVLPPAWENVWISEDPESPLQATGRDAKGRLQYRYHEDWTKARAIAKFDKMIPFASILPVIRRKVDGDMMLKGMPKDKVVALVIKLMDIYHIRVGNDEYARKNKSYGLTTLKEGHITIDRSASAEGKLDAIFEFTGKSGKEWRRRIWEDDLALLIEASAEVGGRSKSQDLFRYEDANGRDFDIKSNHINEYLDASTPANQKVTAKDFRTWAATWKCASRLAEQIDPDTATARKKILTQVIKTVSSDLGNTPAVCRSSYIHPCVISAWEDGRFRKEWNSVNKASKTKRLSKEETATLAFIKQRLNS
ncbi:MAG: DNA topoisomerase IB [Bacteroidota bacterium]